MSAAVGRGDWVECVNDRPKPGLPQPHFRVGGIYRVEAVQRDDLPCVFCGSCGGLQLSGIQHYGTRNSASACRFRPVYRPKQELIDSLKAPPVRVGEPA